MTQKEYRGLRALLVAVVALLGVVALAAAYLVGAGGEDGQDGGDGSTAAGEPARPVAGMRMSGVGKVSAVPDQLGFGVTVTAKRSDLGDALAASNATMNRVLAALDEYGVQKADVQTTGLSMEPEYYYPSSGAPVLTGYRVTQQARVKVRDLTSGGKAISAAVTAGGNDVRVHSITLDVGDPDRYLAQARDAAVADATAKAEQYAEAAGRTLGAVLTVREVASPSPAPQPVYARDVAGLAAGRVPISAGQNTLTVRVQVSWAFE